MFGSIGTMILEFLITRLRRSLAITAIPINVISGSFFPTLPEHPCPGPQ